MTLIDLMGSYNDRALGFKCRLFSTVPHLEGSYEGASSEAACTRFTLKGAICDNRYKHMFLLSVYLPSTGKYLHWT